MERKREIKVNENSLVERANKFRNEIGVSGTAFARNIQIAPITYYTWKRGDIRLSLTTLERIDKYLARYGF